MRVLSFTEAAESAGINRRTFERLIAAGEGPTIVHMSERRRGVLDVDLNTWLMGRRHAAPGESPADQPGSQPAKRGRPRKASPRVAESAE